MTDTPLTAPAIDWQAEADALSAYLISRGIRGNEAIVLLSAALAATARALSDSDEQTRAAIARFSLNIERLAGLRPPTRQ